MSGRVSRRSLFRNRIGQRFFLLFVISAMVPIAVLGVLSLRTVENELTATGLRDLHREAKSIGLALLGRLDLLEDYLTTIRSGLAAESLDGPLPQLPGIGLFSHITIERPGHAPLALRGEPFPSPRLEAEDEQRFAAAQTLLLPRRLSLAGTPTMLVGPLDTRNPEYGRIVAVVDPDFLWQFHSGAEATACVIRVDGSPISCSSLLPESVLQRVAAGAAQRATDGFAWDAGGEQYLLRYWSLFLESRYGVPSWTVVLTEPSASVNASVSQFKRVFPPVIAIALVVIALLSVLQIRRYMVPLEKLRIGTQKFSALELTETIEVGGDDEISELADSFNSMASRLNRQFNTLRTLGDIDRIVLSSLDADYIVETLLTRIGDVVDCASAGVLLLADKEPGRGELRMVGAGADNPEVIRQPVNVDDRSILEMQESTIVYAPLPNCLASLGTTEITHLVIHPIVLDGRTLALLCTGHRHAPSLEDEGINNVRGLADRTAVAMSNAAWEDRLYHQAHYDTLTGLPNRALLRDRLEQSLARARRNSTLVAVLFLDLDHFKNINDSLGHGAGDQLLKKIAGRLSRRGTDTVVRFGGDEFVVVIPDLPDDEHVTTTVAAIADDLCEICAAPVALGEQRVSVTVSVGISLFPRDATDAEDLLRHADTAMYHGKTRGKASCHFYSPEQNAALMERLELATDLRDALEKDQLELYYQPQICATTGDIIGAEALLRWHHPERGMISPDVFIPIAEESELIEKLGAWVLRAACEQLKSWHDVGLPQFRIGINVAARQFLCPSFVADVQRALHETGLQGRYLEVEMTERALMTDVQRTGAALKALSALHVQIAIDDFGTGYSSLAYLARFPIDVLKIDQSFVADILDDPAVANIIRTIVELGHGLGLSVVAEGIESYEQFRQLRELDCDHIQGFLVDRPMPASQVTEFATYWTSTRQHDFFDVTALRPILRA